MIEYHPDSRYTLYKNRLEPIITEAMLLPQAQTIKIAESCMRRAGLSLTGMRPTAFWLESPSLNDNYFSYCGVWYRYVNVQGIGDVRLPESVQIVIDAHTGELDDYLYKNYPVDIEVTPPTVSKERAVELARNAALSPIPFT